MFRFSKCPKINVNVAVLDLKRFHIKRVYVQNKLGFDVVITSFIVAARITNKTVADLCVAYNRFIFLNLIAGKYLHFQEKYLFWIFCNTLKRLRAIIY